MGRSLTLPVAALREQVTAATRDVGRVQLSTSREAKSNQYVLGEHVAIITELLVNVRGFWPG
jgi:hypothetical protein